MLSLTHSHYVVDNVNTQTRFMVLFTSGSLLTWGKPLDALPGVSPRYLSTIYSQLTISPFLLQTSYNDRVCFLFARGRQVEKRDGSNVGKYQHLPLTAMVSYSLPYPSGTVLPEQSQCLGERQKVHHDIAFLLVLVKEEATGGRKYGLSTIWVNPCQARVHSMEKVVGKLTTWVSSGPDWPYALVQLHEGTCHAPLPKEGHLDILPQKRAEMTPCRQISQLEVCQLLILGLQVTYPIGLNGYEEPIITSLLESLANGISLTGGKSIYLEIDILQSLSEEPDLKVLPIGKLSTIIVTNPHKTPQQNWKESAAWPWR